MGKLAIGGLFLVSLAVMNSAACAGPWEDGMAAYNRGDYVPAIQVFHGMARVGNAKAQAMLGTMYQRGQGVTKSRPRAFMWLSMAASRGDAQARADLKTISGVMSPEEMSQAHAMMLACEASDYRNCAY